MNARLGRYVGLFFALAVCVPNLHAQGKTPVEAFALAKLKEGNARFVKNKLNLRDLGPERREQLLKGQKPFAIVLGCADSRVVPEFIFDQGLGEIFVGRNAGNVAGADEIGSIEYAIQKTPSVSLIVVMGHEDCGAIKAAIGGEHMEGDLGWLVKQVDPGKDLPKDPKEALAAAAKHNAVRQAQLMTEKSSIIREFVQSGRVQIIPAYYSLETGKVEWLDIVKVTGKYPAFFRVTVPTVEATVWLDDYKTKARGLTRTFETPPMEANEEFNYTIKVQWSEDGVPMERTKTVYFKGGSKVSVDFSK